MVTVPAWSGQRRWRRALRALMCPACGAYRCPDCKRVIIERPDHDPGCTVYWDTNRGPAS